MPPFSRSTPTTHPVELLTHRSGTQSWCVIDGDRVYPFNNEKAARFAATNEDLDDYGMAAGFTIPETYSDLTASEALAALKLIDPAYDAVRRDEYLTTGAGSSQMFWAFTDDSSEFSRVSWTDLVCQVRAAYDAKVTA